MGIDEGDTLEKKEKIIDNGVQFLEDIVFKPRVAVLSGGRPQDRGRSSRIDSSIREAEQLTMITKDKYPVKHYFILIEDAVSDGANLIQHQMVYVETIFSLVLMGSMKSYGAVTLGIKEIFIDIQISE